MTLLMFVLEEVHVPTPINVHVQLVGEVIPIVACIVVMDRIIAVDMVFVLAPICVVVSISLVQCIF